MNMHDEWCQVNVEQDVTTVRWTRNQHDKLPGSLCQAGFMGQAAEHKHNCLTRHASVIAFKHLLA